MYNYILRLLVVLFVCIRISSFGQLCQIEEAPFNSEQADFSPVYFGEGVVFCSNRSQKILRADADSLPNFYTDLFYMSLGEKDGVELLSKDLTGILNEGPCTFSSDQKTIYYTANISPDDVADRKRVKEYPLGIFIAQWEKNSWVKKEPFPFNGGKKVNNAHPALSPNDSLLFFASNGFDSYGGADLFVCELTSEGWSEPKNLGPQVNTPGDELFPFVSFDDYLYFSSNGYGETTDMDVLSTFQVGSSWARAQKLPPPVNSVHDDFGYVISFNGQDGFVCSNRNGEDDDIFMLSYDFPHFSDCHTNRLSSNCFEIEDAAIAKMANLPMKFEWDLGDGTRLQGSSISHCYDQPGNYFVSLSAVDTLTNSTFMQLSSAMVEVVELDQVYIDCADTVKLGDMCHVIAEQRDLKAFEPKNWYWEVDNVVKRQGKELDYKFRTPGTHTITLGAMGEVDSRGFVPSTCSEAHVVVIDDANWRPSEVTNIPKIHIRVTNFGLLAPLAAEEITSQTYRVDLVRSSSPLLASNKMFAGLKHKISETYDPVLQEYVYSIGPIADIQAAHDLYEKIHATTDLKPLVTINGLVSYEHPSDLVSQVPSHVEPAAPAGTEEVVVDVTTAQVVDEHSLEEEDLDISLDEINPPVESSGESISGDNTVTESDVDLHSIIEAEPNDKVLPDCLPVPIAILDSNGSVPMEEELVASEETTTKSANLATDQTIDPEALDILDNQGSVPTEDDLANVGKVITNAEDLADYLQAEPVSTEPVAADIISEVPSEQPIQEIQVDDEIELADNLNILLQELIPADEPNMGAEMQIDEPNDIQSDVTSREIEKAQNGAPFCDVEVDKDLPERHQELTKTRQAQIEEIISLGPNQEMLHVETPQIRQENSAAVTELPEVLPPDPSHRFVVNQELVEQLDGLPVIFKWNVGDGKPIVGTDISHTYPFPGLYEVSLIAVDTTVETTFAAIYKNRIEVLSALKMHITSADTVQLGASFTMIADQSNLSDLATENWFWVIDSQHYLQGKHVELSFNETGRHDVVLSALDPQSEGTDNSSLLSRKSIVVVDDPLWTATEKNEVQIIEVGVKDYLTTNLITDNDPGYVVEIARSATAIEISDDRFIGVRDIINECFDEASGQYVYSVGPVLNLKEAHAVFERINSETELHPLVKPVVMEHFVEKAVEIGAYRSERSIKWTAMFNGLDDVRFDYNSDIIGDDSGNTLDYIVAMMKLETEFNLYVDAHTCDIGSALYNLRLSEKRGDAVRKYLVSMGIDADRIIVESFGFLEPKLPNKGDYERTVNRRVEFTVSFEH